MNTADLYAKPGEPIRPKMRALASHIAQMAIVQSGRGVRIHKYRNGSAIVSEKASDSFVGSFFVRLSSEKVIVGAGMVDGMVPTINGTPIDGVTATGKQGKVPELTLSSGPNATLRSWVCIEVVYDIETKRIAEMENGDALKITHRNDLPLTGTNTNADGLLVLVKPIALLMWQTIKVVARSKQIAYFDLRTITEDGETRLDEAA